MLTFVFASLALLIVPGPSVMMVVTRAISLGRRAGLICVLGNTLAVVIVAAAVALGLAQLIEWSPLLFDIVKWAGAAYLVFLGMRALLDKTSINLSHSVTPMSDRALFTQGITTGLLNPKLAVFFAAFLPQFADPRAGNVPMQLFGLGMLFAGLALCSDGAYALLAGTLGDRLRRNPIAATVLRWASGVTCIGLGARLAFERSR